MSILRLLCRLDGTEQVTDHGAIPNVDLAMNDGSDTHVVLDSALGEIIHQRRHRTIEET